MNNQTSNAKKYTKLMNNNPTHYGTWINKEGQTIDFYECPFQGGDIQVVCVSHALKLACYSDFYETTDMIQDHREYEPSFTNGVLYMGEFQVD